MVYDPKAWVTGELITAEDLNRIEQGIDGKVDMADARLSDARTPLTHTHADLVARLAALEQDTGWRAIDSLVVSPAASLGAGECLIRRVGKTVHALAAIKPASGTAGQNLAMPVPVGFRAGRMLRGHRTYNGQPAMVQNGAITLYYVSAGGDRLYAVYPTDEAWPTTLPGTPA